MTLPHSLKYTLMLREQDTNVDVIKVVEVLTPEKVRQPVERKWYS